MAIIRSASSLLLAAASSLCLLHAAHAAPYVPKDGSQVIEHLPARISAEQREIRAWQERLRADPGNVTLAVQVARRDIELGRSHSDPRYFGYAQAALSPWWKQPDAPVEVRVLRATLLQNQHRFNDALADLDGLLAKDASQSQAWLTKATILQVQGRFEEAKASCARLYGNVSEVAAVACFVGVGSMTGQARQSYALLERTLQRERNLDPSISVWVHTLLGEIATRLGRSQEAERHYRKGLEQDSNDSYLLGAYADLLLDTGRAQEAVALLRDRDRVDNLLLRKAEALHKLKSPDAAQAIRTLQERFDAARLRGDTVHLREQARFELHLLDDAQAALQTAQRNWEVQKEPADTRILLEAALAAHDRSGTRMMADWIRKNRLEDKTLAELCSLAGETV
jgi:tetratricopeptide (TPR) repeat protein